MTFEEARHEVLDHYVPCCDEAKVILEAARVLLTEIYALRESNADLRGQRDAARAVIAAGEASCNLSDPVLVRT